MDEQERISDGDPFDRVMEREREHRRRSRRKRARRALRFHAWVYLAVNAALTAGWLVGVWLGEEAVGERTPWFLASAAGWGVGLGVHVLAVHRPRRRRRPTSPPTSPLPGSPGSSRE